MNVLYRLFVCAALCGSVACSESGIDSSEPAPAGEQLRTVVIGCGGIGIDTRTDIEETPDSLDGKAYLGVRWSSGDCIRLWARESATGTSVLEDTPFEFDYYSPLWSRAAFTGHEVNMAGFLDDEGNVSTSKFDYFAVSPAPKSVEGTSATFDIPAVQSGEFNCGLDIMTAQLTGAPALEAGDTNWAKGFCLPFKHHVHVLKIEITNNLLKSPKSDKQAGISAIELTFPVPVTGQLTVDAATGKARLEEGGENVLTLRFATPKKKGDVVYAFIAPQESFSGDIKIKATGASEGGKTCSSVERSFTKPEGMFACGAVTPVHYNIPERYRCTKIIFSLTEKDGEARTVPISVAAKNGYGWGTLGEEITSFRIVDVEKTTPEKEVVLPDCSFNVNDEELGYTHVKNRYEISCTAESEDAHTKFLEKYAGKECIAKLTSEHAEVECSFTFPPLEAEVENPVPALAVPYLFEEDFSSITQSHGRDEGTAMLSDYGMPANGWSISRYMIEPGRVACYTHIGTSTSSYKRKDGRLDSPFLPLTNSAADAELVSLNVSYDIGGVRNEGASYVFPNAALSWWVSVCEFGTDSRAGALSGDKAIENKCSSFAPTVGGSLTSETLPMTRPEVVANCKAPIRLSWRANYEMESSEGSSPTVTKKDFLLYIDNIKVSIAHDENK